MIALWNGRKEFLAEMFWYHFIYSIHVKTVDDEKPKAASASLDIEIKNQRHIKHLQGLSRSGNISSVFDSIFHATHNK